MTSHFTWPFLAQTKDGWVLSVRVQPNAKKTAMVGIRAEKLVIALHAKPVDGAANLALLEALHDWLDVPKSQLVLLRGEKSREKQVQLPNRPEVLKKLEEQLGS